MKPLKYIMLVICVSICGQVMAQGSIGSLIDKVKTMRDSIVVKGIDRRYIDVPDKPWQIILRTNVNQTIVSMQTEGTMAGHDYSAKPYLKTTPSKHLGLWVGYRGLGMGYSMNVGGDKGRKLTFGCTGGAYGVNVHIHSFENSNPDFNLNSNLLTEENKEAWNDIHLTEPIRVRTVFADAYYMFNGKHFSYSAAYKQRVIQKRSAGSLMAGLMYNYTRIDYASHSNGDLVYLMEGLGKVKLWQGSAGVGYTYNWVPARGLLVNVLAMPMLTFVNKLKGYGYATNVPELMEDPRFFDPNTTDEEWDEWFYSNVRIQHVADQTFNSGLSIGFDARLSVTYNIGDVFFNAYGQFNNIRYRHNNSKGYLNDWFINTSVGLRL